MGYYLQDRIQDGIQNTSDETDETVATGIGWTSILVGAAELFLTRRLERMLGIGTGRQHSGVLKALGVRELMHGFDLLSHRDPLPGVWARVAGDVLDTALLGMAARKTRNPSGFGTILAIVLGIGLVDLAFATHLDRKRH